MNRIILIVGFLLLSCNSWSQTKNEQEERVKLEALPETVIDLVNTLPKECKRLRFYKETDGETQSFEVKFKYKKQHYSIECSTIGRVEDIEVIVEPKQIKTTAKSEIDAYFKENFQKSKLIKVQLQYVYTSTEVISVFVNNVLSKTNDLNVNYEIVAEVKSDSKREVCEFLFNENGSFVGYKTLNSNSYEHVLH